ncbi:MAG: putative DNA binding domain-containing protein [Ekhidna sp.]|nr:putative DNA binding domain-containing protein [Ekhidna sp.]
MNDWINTARELLKQSLNPIPQELNEIDWKSGLSGKTDRIAQHIAAFANHENGGYLVYGIGNDGKHRPLEKSEMDDIIQKVGNIARNNLTQPIGIDHAISEYEGNAILFIKIPEYHDKPVSLRGNDIYKTYKRSAGQTVKQSKQEVSQLIALSSGINFEAQIAKPNAENDEVLNLLDFDGYFTRQEKRLPGTKEAILEVLENDDLIKKSSKNWDILNIGAILFAKDLKKFKALKRKAVRVIIYDKTSRIDALKEREGVKGYANGFEGLVNYIMDQLPANEMIDQALRKQVKVYPEVAIREFTANALIHQDFSITGSGVMVEIFSERIEITNPGAPLVDTNRFIDTAPKSRNESLASLMRRLDICEERGSGVDRAIAAIEAYQLPAPKFIRGEGYTRVILYAPTTLTRMSSEDRARACYQHTCLHYVSNQMVNNQSVRKRFKIGVNSVSMASKIISETIESGLIKLSDPKNSSKKFASYVPFWA